MRTRGRPPYPDVLTPREWEVLALVREGLTNQQIATRLGISLNGAKYHVSEILTKLGLEGRKEAAQWRASRPRYAGLPVLGWLWRRREASAAPGLLSLAATAVSVTLLALVLVGLGVVAILLQRGGEGEGTPSQPLALLSPTLVTTISDVISPNVTWSPTGDRVVYVREDGLYVAREPDFEARLLVEARPVPPLVRGQAWLIWDRPRFVWAPDGTRLAFAGEAEAGGTTIFIVNADGSGLRDLLSGGAGQSALAPPWPNVWLDNDTVAFEAGELEGLRVPMEVNVRTGEVKQALPEADAQPFSGDLVTWSPDRSLIAIDGAQPEPTPGTLRVVEADTGASWDLPGDSDEFASRFQQWLPDSSGLIYKRAGSGDLAVWWAENQRAEILVEQDRSTHLQEAAISPDGPILAVDVSLETCDSSPPYQGGRCVLFLDVESGAEASSVALRYLPDTPVANAPVGLRGWLIGDAVAFVGPADEPTRSGNVLWLIQNPADPQLQRWQEATVAHLSIDVHPSADGRYAIVTMGTSDNLFAETNFWDARIYRMR